MTQSFTKVATMSELKCPFCGEKLQEDIGYDGDYSCPNCRTPYFGSLELWQELIRTRKALNVAKEGLKEIQDKGEYVNVIELAEYYLDEITALEKAELENLEMLVNNVFK